MPAINNVYGYVDNYMYFSFAGKHSSQYNLFMINEGEDLQFYSDLSSSSDYTSPAFQEVTYHLGTYNTQKTISKRCAAKGLSFAACQDMLKWLKPGTTGILVFDNNPYWGYTVVLESVSDTTFYTAEEGYIIEFELNFKTIGKYYATGIRTPYLDDLSLGDENDYNPYRASLANEYGIIEIVSTDLIESYADDVSEEPEKEPNKIVLYLCPIANEYMFFNLKDFNFVGLIDDERTYIIELSVDDEIVAHYEFKFSNNAQKDSSLTLSYYGENGLWISEGEVSNVIFEKSLKENELVYGYTSPVKISCTPPRTINNDNDFNSLFLSSEEQAEDCYHRAVFKSIAVHKPATYWDEQDSVFDCWFSSDTTIYDEISYQEPIDSAQVTFDGVGSPEGPQIITAGYANKIVLSIKENVPDGKEESAELAIKGGSVEVYRFNTI